MPRLRVILLAAAGLLAALAVGSLSGGAPPREAGEAMTAPTSPAEASHWAPSSQRRVARVKPATPETLPPVRAEPLFQAGLRANQEQTTRLRFALHDRIAGFAAPGAALSASVFHGTDPELRLPVEQVDDGVFEVPFTPHGPGQFNVVLSLNGVPVGSGKVGVVGAVGARGDRALLDPLSALDPVEFPARTPAMGRRR